MCHLKSCQEPNSGCTTITTQSEPKEERQFYKAKIIKDGKGNTTIIAEVDLTCLKHGDSLADYIADTRSDADLD
ncbi:MAG: hypothetical protein LUQ22_01760 [Methanotrichaceae archaeon]|nr:hypothetical protein [Methanotrichaceae archaeon]